MRTLSNQLLTLIRSVRTLVFFEIIRACGEVILNTEFSIDELFGQNFKMLNAIDAKGPVAFPKMAPSEKNPFGLTDLHQDFATHPEMVIIVISDRRDGRSNAESRYLRFRLQEC